MHRLAQLLRAPVVTDPACDADGKSHGEILVQRSSVPGKAVDYRFLADILVFLEPFDKILRGTALMQKQRLAQLFSENDMFLETSDLVLLCREHPVIIQTTLTDRNNFFVLGNDSFNPCKIFLHRPVRIVRVDPRCTVCVMRPHELVDLLVLLGICSCQNAAHPLIHGIPNDLLRIRKLPAEQI